MSLVMPFFAVSVAVTSLYEPLDNVSDGIAIRRFTYRRRTFQMSVLENVDGIARLANTLDERVGRTRLRHCLTCFVDEASDEGGATNTGCGWAGTSGVAGSPSQTEHILM